MPIDESASRDQTWTRTPLARVMRELVICGVFGSIVGAYSHREVAGLEHLERLAGPVIFVANHCSHVDTPVLLLSLPARWRRRTAVAAAADYFYTTRLLASAVSLAFGTVPLERRGRRVGIDAAHIRHLLEGGWSLVVFAEGTRSRDGRVAGMRSGASLLAVEHGLPIVPVHISGTHEAMPIGRNWMIRPQGRGRWARHTISVSFGSPIDVGLLDDCFEAMAGVRRFMEACGAQTAPDGAHTAPDGAQTAPDPDLGAPRAAATLRAPRRQRPLRGQRA